MCSGGSVLSIRDRFHEGEAPLRALRTDFDGETSTEGPYGFAFARLHQQRASCDVGHGVAAI